ncbi:MAG: methylenetetrahydrofolate--tRNA-(uracil(54)-C(5))-methyltransferase (FADH(2)-oxidizing) TrmFO [Bacteroidia bacterium]|nr:methylenetetrahydrofolate--tRNA-(uracil(54)-C(5))-methyltransferase (FADH(2)-oxidizing) TrmFO [Bacteroidia bacterium]
MAKINIIGAGLAGVEAAHYLANQGHEVHLFEMRPKTMTPAHQTGDFAELVCSNSLKSNRLDNACGLLKEEMRIMNSLTMEVASKTAVPSGNALSVDRELFAKEITAKILQNKHIFIHHEEVTRLPDELTILATGPLSSDALIDNLNQVIGGDCLSFYDASAPIIAKSSIDFDIAYFKSRYEQGDDSYLNCPMNKEQYYRFVDELVSAKTVKLHDFESQYFEGCLPVEVIAKRGRDTLRYGPLKPKGLALDRSAPPYAVVQLRQDDLVASMYNIVGFQTNLTYGEQERVFRLIPGLEKAEFVRYGLMHRNTYINAPKALNGNLSLRNKPNIIIAGQLSGVEGYVESAACGLIAGIVAHHLALGKEALLPPTSTMIGSLLRYITKANPINFTPMNANFGILDNADKRHRDNDAQVALQAIGEYWKACNE